MSCGKPHQTPCDEVLADVYVFLDSECDKERKAKIRQHLEECGPCLQKFGIESEVKALVHRSCQEKAPEGLRDRLRDRLRTAVVETSIETIVTGDDGVVTRVTTFEMRTTTRDPG